MSEVVFWAVVLPVWLAIDYWLRPNYRRAFAGGWSHFLRGELLIVSPTWVMIMFLQLPMPGPLQPLWPWRLLLGMAVAAGLHIGLRALFPQLAKDVRHAAERARELPA